MKQQLSPAFKRHVFKYNNLKSSRLEGNKDTAQSDPNTLTPRFNCSYTCILPHTKPRNKLPLVSVPR